MSDIEEDDSQDDSNVSTIKPSHMNFELQLEMTLPQIRLAEIMYTTLIVDKVFRKHEVWRRLELNDKTLKIHYAATEAKILRVTTTNFFKGLELILQTIMRFDVVKDDE
mmetsp:Transcript_15121/g.25991  ORF Transcript_15121/g.25991 Transcript_15121/m.25991 type:complete len:109 (+) Transcript_15121:18-344(+)